MGCKKHRRVRNMLAQRGDPGNVVDTSCKNTVYPRHPIAG
jgi:hypothetical protein